MGLWEHGGEVGNCFQPHDKCHLAIPPIYQDWNSKWHLFAKSRLSHFPLDDMYQSPRGKLELQGSRKGNGIQIQPVFFQCPLFVKHVTDSVCAHAHVSVLCVCNNLLSKLHYTDAENLPQWTNTASKWVGRSRLYPRFYSSKSKAKALPSDHRCHSKRNLRPPLLAVS
jgi:hypothetical protein